MALVKVNPPPLGDPLSDGSGKISKAWAIWLQVFWKKLGAATTDAPINSVNITGTLATAHLVVGAAFNTSNDATADTVDVDATNTTVRIYGPGGVGTAWNVYRNGVLLASYAATTFTGKAYATTYYIGYDIGTAAWTISTTYSDITGDNMVIFAVRTHDANGVVGAGAGGGGSQGTGGTGGTTTNGGGGYGRLR